MTFREFLYYLLSGTTEQQQPIRPQSVISPDPNIFTYRTEDGQRYFQFSYHQIGSRKYEIDIHMMPSLNGRSSNQHTIHVLNSPRRGVKHKICIHSGKEPKSLHDAKEVSKVYAELINEYIKTGKTPDAQLRS